MISLPIEDNSRLMHLVHYSKGIKPKDRWKLYEEMSPVGQAVARVFFTGKGTKDSKSAANAYIKSVLVSYAYGAWKKKQIEDNRDAYERGAFPRYISPGQYWIDAYVKKIRKKFVESLKLDITQFTK